MKSWQSQTTPPPLPSEHIHIWLVPLEQAPEVLAQFRSTLAADELERCDRFRFEKHRNQYIVGRGLLRFLLGQYLDTSPTNLQFSYSEYDKPSLVKDVGATMHFNLSHSNELALLGFCRTKEVGIDLEHHRPGFATGEIAERFFAPLEVAKLNQLPESQQTAAFFRCWTRKEAFLKATGDGLTRELDSFQVSLAADEAPALLWLQDGGDPKQWQVEDINLHDEAYSAALVYQGQRIPCTYLAWTVA